MPEVRYIRTDGQLPQTVTYCLDEQGREFFLMQDLRNNECLPFSPSPDERDVARQILQEATKDNGALRLHFEEGQLTVDWSR